MSLYQPQGRAHRLLERLAEQDQGFAALLDAVRSGEPDFPRKRAWHILGSMLADEMIGGVRQRYYILPRGREVLSVLQAGNDFTIRPTTSIRVFA